MGDIDLTGKVCIVTGGGRGLGRAMTLALVGSGAKVCAVMHIAEDMDAIAAACDGIPGGGGAHPMLADIRDPAACERAVEETIAALGGLHVLVNNAGVGMLLISETFTTDPPKFWEGGVDAWRQIVETNFLGSYHMARAAIPRFLAQGWGRIVNVTTSIGTMQRGGNSPYGSTKAALEAASSSWAGDVESSGVTVNVLLPGGAADTHMLPGEPGEPGRMGTDQRPLDPDVMQAPIVWLASDYSDGVNGLRFIGKDWSPDLPPERGAENAVGLAGIALRTE